MAEWAWLIVVPESVVGTPCIKPCFEDCGCGARFEGVCNNVEVVDGICDCSVKLVSGKEPCPSFV